MTQQICGIYKVENLINGKKYIGQSVNIPKRWIKHRSDAFNKNCNHYDKILYKAIRKYGLENFSFEVIEYCSIEELNDKEYYWVNHYDSYHHGYNATLGGDGADLEKYNNIYEDWKSGKTCKELEKKYNCKDSVITNALRVHNISEFEAKSRSIKFKNKILAMSFNGKPLMVFEGSKAIARYFEMPEASFDNLTTTIRKNVKSSASFQGYEWKFYENETVPSLTKEEFFSYQNIGKSYSKEERLELSLTHRTVERPSREELKKLIRTEPFTQIGRNYGVTDNAIRKWCQFENLPYKKRDIKAYSDYEWEQL